MPPARPGKARVFSRPPGIKASFIPVTGTLVGFWAPRCSRAVTVPGHHYHLISEDRKVGGHVLDLRSGPMTVQVQVESDLHLVIPETVEFLTADLSCEHELELAAAGSERAST